MTREELYMIQEIVGGYKFKSLDLLQQAFIRRSYSEECGGENNEVLEFIGDKVLDFVVVKILTSLGDNGYGCMSAEKDGFNANEDWNEYCCKYDEQKLTEIKKKLVCKEMLAKCIDEMALQKHLVMGKGDIEQNLYENDSVKEDLFEAILGAIAIDSNYDIGKLEQAVDVMLAPTSRIETEILGNEVDYVTLIRQWHTKENNGLLPAFIFKEESGSIYWYFNDGAITRNYPLGSGVPFASPSFSCLIKMKINGREIHFRDFGKSKSEARQKVCELAYGYLSENGLLYTIEDEVENPNKNEAISQLEILARRGYFSLPIYKFKQSYDKQGNPIWKAECHIKEKDYFYYAISSSKKEAKKTSAWKMLKKILNIEEVQ